MYVNGRDITGRPIIYFNLALIDFIKHSISEYYCAFNHLAKSVMERYFEPGKVEKWIVVLNTSEKVFLPIHIL